MTGYTETLASQPDADSPDEAARQAREIQTDVGSASSSDSGVSPRTRGRSRSISLAARSNTCRSVP